MNQISPILKSKIENQTSGINNKDLRESLKINTANLKQPEQDTVDISSNNKETKEETAEVIKKAMLVGASAALIGASIIALIKMADTSKIKKELTIIYDAVFDNMNKNTPENINFEKPKLVFKRLSKQLAGGYLPHTNEIYIDPRDIRRTFIVRDLSKAYTTNLTDKLEIAELEYKGDLTSLLKNALGGTFRVATKNEALSLRGATFGHELTHARQFQILLSSEGAREKYIEYLKSTSGLPYEVLKKEASFVFNYRPKEILPANFKITEKLPDENYFIYTLKHISDAFTNYTKSDSLKYFTNLTEVSAKNSEHAYWERLLNGTLPRLKGVSDEFLIYAKKISNYNANKLRKAASNISQGLEV